MTDLIFHPDPAINAVLVENYNLREKWAQDNAVGMFLEKPQKHESEEDYHKARREREERITGYQIECRKKRKEPPVVEVEAEAEVEVEVEETDEGWSSTWAEIPEQKQEEVEPHKEAVIAGPPYKIDMYSKWGEGAFRNKQRTYESDYNAHLDNGDWYAAEFCRRTAYCHRLNFHINSTQHDPNYWRGVALQHGFIDIREAA